MITSHILCHLQVTGIGDTKTKCASCKHLTKIFGSKHPAIEYLSAFVSCSSSEIVLSVSTQLRMSLYSIKTCVLIIHMHLRTYVHNYRIMYYMPHTCTVHVWGNCCNCEFKMKNPLTMSQWKCKVCWKCKWYCTWQSDKRCNRSCTTLFVSHNPVCVRVCVYVCAEGLVGDLHTSEIMHGMKCQQFQLCLFVHLRTSHMWAVCVRKSIQPRRTFKGSVDKLASEGMWQYHVWHWWNNVRIHRALELAQSSSRCHHFRSLNRLKTLHSSILWNIWMDNGRICFPTVLIIQLFISFYKK